MFALERSPVDDSSIGGYRSIDPVYVRLPRLVSTANRRATSFTAMNADVISLLARNLHAALEEASYVYLVSSLCAPFATALMCDGCSRDVRQLGFYVAELVEVRPLVPAAEGTHGALTLPCSLADTDPSSTHASHQGPLARAGRPDAQRDQLMSRAKRRIGDVPTTTVTAEVGSMLATWRTPKSSSTTTSSPTRSIVT